MIYKISKTFKFLNISCLQENVSPGEHMSYTVNIKEHVFKFLLLALHHHNFAAQLYESGVGKYVLDICQTF